MEKNEPNRVLEEAYAIARDDCLKAGFAYDDAEIAYEKAKAAYEKSIKERRRG